MITNTPSDEAAQALVAKNTDALCIKMAVSIFSGGVQDTLPENKNGSLRDLIPHLEKQHATANKTACPMLKLGIFKGGAKTTDISHFTGVMGDYDAETVGPAEAAERLGGAGIGGIVYTTASHTPDAPRWRVLVPLAAPVDRDGLVEMTGKVNAALGGILGSESFNPALRYFTGVPANSHPPEVYSIEGRPVDAVEGLESVVPQRAKPKDRVSNPDPCPFDFQTCITALAALDPEKHLPDDRGAHYEWLRNIVWSFADATGGSADARDAALRWREGVEGIDSHERKKFNRIWNSDTDKPAGVGWPTLFYLAREAGWAEFGVDDFDDLPLVDNLDDDLAELLGLPMVDAYASKLEWAHEIQPVIESTYLLEDRLSINGLSVCYGAPNAGKTFFLLQLAFHLAQGEAFYGARCKPTAVLYLALEGGNLIANRVVALAREADRFIPFTLRRAGFNLLRPDGDVKEIVGLHRSMMRTVGDMPSLIVIDTLSRALAGGDENSPKDMTAFVKNVDAIRQRTGAHVMVVHHSGKDEARGMRGHSSLLGAIDTELQIKAEGTGGVRTAEFGKQRDYAEDHRPLGFTLQDVVLGVTSEGKDVRTAVAIATDVPMPSAADKLPPSAKAALAVLERAGGEMDCRAWQDACTTGYELSQSDDLRGRQKAFRRARERLVDAGVVDCDGQVCSIWTDDVFDDLD